jgi:hypothetical protein
MYIILSRSACVILFDPPSSFFVINDRESILIEPITINEVDVFDISMVFDAWTNTSEVQRIRILIGAVVDSVPDDVLGCEILCVVEAGITRLLLDVLKERLKLLQSTALSIRITIPMNIDICADRSSIGEFDL